MPKIKLGNLRNVYAIFQGLSAIKYNPIFSYTVLKIMRRLEEEFKIFNETLRTLQLEYAKVDGNNNVIANKQGQIQFESDDKANEYNSRANELYQMEIEIDCLKISLSQLANNNVEISVEELKTIEDFLEIDV